jgi:hypothetical protein
LPVAEAYLAALTVLWTFPPSFQHVATFIHAYLEQALIGAHHRVLEVFANPSRRPPHGKLDGCRRGRRRPKAGRNVCSLILAGLCQDDEKLVASYAHH